MPKKESKITSTSTTTTTTPSPSETKIEEEKTTSTPPTNLAKEVKHMFEEAKQTVKGWGKKVIGKAEDVKESTSTEKITETGGKVMEGKETKEKHGHKIK